MTDQLRSGRILSGLLANLLVVITVVYAALLEWGDPSFYYMSVQEDEYLEWGTFWAFLIAAGVCLVGAVRQRRAARRFPWFFLGIALFCVFVAMEEISWGQRLIGYRPPSYFLEHNFQQELNLHNIVDTPYRKLAMKAVIGGYGVVLPFLALIPAVRHALRQAAVVEPPAVMIPAFLVTYVTYVWYPWKMSGEWVECMLGLAFLLAAIMRARDYRPGSASAGAPLPEGAWLALSWAVVVALGVGGAAASRSQRGAHPQNIEAARVETEALKRDFLRRETRTRCGLHKRVYTYVEAYKQADLREGDFAGLTAQGLPERRADFFLDPWNLPYWIRDNCSRKKERRTVFVYSFGPNRRRESTRWAIRGDDVGAIIFERRKNGG